MPSFRQKPTGFEQVTALSSAAALTAAQTAKANCVVLCARDQAVNYRDDGTDPTATVGITLAVGVPFTYDGDLSAIKFIQAAATAKLDVAYYLVTG